MNGVGDHGPGMGENTGKKLEPRKEDVPDDGDQGDPVGYPAEFVSGRAAEGFIGGSAA